uniref:hypothetical protein n=1 Tax=Elizabethkingia meningoseptica TaxID=238 RepID=UPI003891A53F
MKTYLKLIILLTFVFSLNIKAQKLSQDQIVDKVIKEEGNYKNKNLSEVLKQFPDMKMIRINPNFPESNDIMFTIGFVSNDEFSKMIWSNTKTTSITLYLEQNPNNPVSFKGGRED